MNKLALYNLALSLLDMKISDLQTQTKELTLLELNYSKVVSYCLKAWDFPFLVKMLVLTEVQEDTDGYPVPWGKYQYGYTVPPDFSRAIRINADERISYAYRFGKLWCNEDNPELEYMPNDLELDDDGNYTAPNDFLALLAYQLALHVAPMLDPQSQAQSIAAQMYQLTLASITESETRSNNRPTNYESSNPWEGELVITSQAVRDAIIRGEI